ncbi:MAG: hypothetical protein ABI406_19335 [Ktedonobacteraceae bacterium]
MATRKGVPITDIEGWYTAGNAAEKLTKTSGREVKPAYVRSLARLGKVETKKIGERTTLYNKADIDAYRVEAPAEKANRARRG